MTAIGCRGVVAGCRCAWLGGVVVDHHRNSGRAAGVPLQAVCSPVAARVAIATKWVELLDLPSRLVSLGGTAVAPGPWWDCTEGEKWGDSREVGTTLAVGVGVGGTNVQAMHVAVTFACSPTGP
jgi:hypothetical protein